MQVSIFISHVHVEDHSLVAKSLSIKTISGQKTSNFVEINHASCQILPYLLLPEHLVSPVVLVLYTLLVHLHCPAKVRQ